MGQHPGKKLPGGPLAGPNARQGELSSSGQLSDTASKTDVLRPDKTEASSVDNSESLKGTQKRIFWQTSIEDHRSKLKILRLKEWLTLEQMSPLSLQNLGL